MADEPQTQQRPGYRPPATPPLTDTEIREVRDMLEADRRVKWFWGKARTMAIWVAAVVGGIMVAWEGFVKLITAAGGD